MKNKDTLTKNRSLPNAEQRKTLQLQINEATRSEANKLGWGSMPTTTPEKSRAPAPSRKGACRKKRGVQ